MIITDSHLLAVIDGFLARTGWAETRFGVMCCNDKHLVRQLRAGRSVSLRKAAQIVDFIRGHGDLPVGDTDNSRDIQRLASASDTGDTDSVSPDGPTQQEVAA